MFFNTTKKATIETLKAPWLGAKNGIYFKCCFCGYKFLLDDLYTVVYTNDMVGAAGNPIACSNCGDDKDLNSLREKWKEKCEKAYTEYWWFVRE